MVSPSGGMRSLWPSVDDSRPRTKGGVFELVVDRGLGADERVQGRDLRAPLERLAGLRARTRVPCPARLKHGPAACPASSGSIAAEVDHPGELPRASLERVEVLPDVLVNIEGGDPVEPGLVGVDSHLFFAHPSSPHRETNYRYTIRARVTPGTSCNMRRRHPQPVATTPHEGHPAGVVGT